MQYNLCCRTHLNSINETYKSEESGSTGDGSYGQAKTSATAAEINLLLFIFMLISISL